MGILHSWKGRYHQLYVPCPSMKVRVSCFQISLMSMATPHRKKSLSEKCEKDFRIREYSAFVFKSSFVLVNIFVFYKR